VFAHGASVSGWPNALQGPIEIFDLTREIRTGMPVYPGDPEVSVEQVNELPALSRLELGSHSGTHVDAQSHFITGGKGVEALPLDALVGPCTVVVGEGVAERVLIKDAAPFDEASATGLVEAGVRLVGVDGMSVGDREAHRVLLGAEVVVVESLDLSAVEPGEYELICLPLRIADCDGSPARAILVRR
jgi:arylformamidase